MHIKMKDNYVCQKIGYNNKPVYIFRGFDSIRLEFLLCKLSNNNTLDFLKTAIGT